MKIYMINIAISIENIIENEGRRGVGRSGGSEVRRSGGPEVRRSGGPEVRRSGGREVGRSEVGRSRVGILGMLGNLIGNL